MVIANVDWLGILCTALSLASAAQLIITGTLSFGLSEFLAFTGCLYATGAGLVAGFVILPTILRIKTSQISPNMDKIYGYTLCYQRLAISVSLAIHSIAAALAVLAIVCSKNLDHEFLVLMKLYHTKQSSKSMVDNIQWALQCCGSLGYKDWFGIDWSGYNFDPIQNRKKSVEEMLKQDVEAYPDLITIREDNVPFSCCARISSSICVHNNLILLGISTINAVGCAKKLHMNVHYLLIFEIFMYSLCISLEVAILMLLRKPLELFDQETVNSTLSRFDSSTEEIRWGKFTNETSPSSNYTYETTTSSTNPSKSTSQLALAEISPSSHAQITIYKNTP